MHPYKPAGVTSAEPFFLPLLAPLPSPFSFHFSYNDYKFHLNYNSLFILESFFLFTTFFISLFFLRHAILIAGLSGTMNSLQTLWIGIRKGSLSLSLWLSVYLSVYLVFWTAWIIHLHVSKLPFSYRVSISSSLSSFSSTRYALLWYW